MKQAVQLEEAITADLRIKTLVHLVMAVKHCVGTTHVQEIAKRRGLSRRRGRKPETALLRVASRSNT
jgi:hypothetical protein